MLIIWECALRGKLKLDDEALLERLEEWLLAMNDSAEIDHQEFIITERMNDPTLLISNIKC